MSISIDNFGTLYNQTSTQVSNTSANKLSETLSGELSNATEEELMDVCKDFEAYFIEQVIKEVKKTIPESSDKDNATKQLKEYFEDEVVKQYAENIADSGDFGIARTLYEQMKRNYNL